MTSIAQERRHRADNALYIGRHGTGLLSEIARATRDAERAERAVIVLAATDHLPASRELYRRLLRAGALTFTSAPTFAGSCRWRSAS